MRDLSTARSQPQVTLCGGVDALPPASRFIMRGGVKVSTTAGTVFGVEVPTVACRAHGAGERAALWLGPDEWLLIAPLTDGNTLERSLSGALKDLPHSLVDVSHRQTALVVSGPFATMLLAAGCPLDLDERSFPVGMCTRTMFAKAEVVLWRTAAATFRLEVWRSFAAYVSLYLADAARGMI
ncbi:MAG TPA: sarcosine oxidase subunit gamma family protein [Steroidobacteraceae bacterium]|nr:sarcosine oxidase subunit gamma family protein [Steroidobacteraceae bacterium]